MAPRRVRRRPVAADDLYRLRFVADPQVSPDGAHGRLRRRLGRRRGPYPLSIAADAGAVRRIEPAARADQRAGIATPRRAGRQTASRWRLSPTATTPRAQLFLLPLQRRRAATADRAQARRGRAPSGRRSGDRLAFSARVDVEAIASQEGQSDEKGKPPRVKIITRVRHKGDGEGFFEAVRRHLFVLDVDGAASRRRSPTATGTTPSQPGRPTGKLLAFTSNRERDRDLSLLNDVWVVPSARRAGQAADAPPRQAPRPRFRPMAAQVAYLGHERGWTYGARTELLAVPVDGRRLDVDLGAAFEDELGNAALSDAARPGRGPAADLAARRQSLLGLVSRYGRGRVVRFACRRRHSRAVVVGGDREVASFSVAADGARRGLRISDPTHAVRSLRRSDDGQERRLSHENDALLETLDVAAAEPFQVTSTDGQTVTAG